MILAVFATAALAGEPLDGSIGLSADLVARQGSSRHDVAGALQAWGGYAAGQWGLLAEIGAGPSVDRTTLYRYSGWKFGGDLLVEGILAPHATAFHAGIGPAIALHTVQFASGDLSGHATRAEGGVRLRIGLDGPIGSHLAWSWHIGTVIRPSGSDWDAGLGLGIAL